MMLPSIHFQRFTRASRGDLAPTAGPRRHKHADPGARIFRRGIVSERVDACYDSSTMQIRVIDLLNSLTGCRWDYDAVVRETRVDHINAALELISSGADAPTIVLSTSCVGGGLTMVDGVISGKKIAAALLAFHRNEWRFERVYCDAGLGDNEHAYDKLFGELDEHVRSNIEQMRVDVTFVSDQFVKCMHQMLRDR